MLTIFQRGIDPAIFQIQRKRGISGIDNTDISHNSVVLKVKFRYNEPTI